MKRFLMAGVCLCGVVSAQGAEHAMTAGNAGGTSSFNSGTNWDDNLPPAAGNTYRTTNFIMRTPEVVGSFAFAGDSLTVNNNGAMAWKTTGALTVSNLILEGPIQHWIGGVTGRLYGNITIPAPRTGIFTAGATEGDTRIFEVYSTVSGSGNLQVTMGNVTALKQTSLFADNSGFTGRTMLQGLGKFGICMEESLGANPATFTANKLEFSGMTLVVTNALTLDDPNRGLLLNNTLNAVNQIYPGGAIEVANQVTATVACVISGAGPLTKRGNGALLLATNATYTGATTVEAGTLRLAPAWTLASQTLTVTGSTAVVAGEGTLSNVTLVAGGRLVAEKGGWSIKNLAVQNTTNVTFALDLSEANPDTTLIRVSGALSKQPLQVFQFVVNTNNATSVPYKVLSASNLNDFAEYDFCVTPPWIGELSSTNDGSGAVLLFTPTLPENIAFKTGSDALNDTGFTNALWSTLAPPSPEKTYVYRAGALRTPQTGSLTFPGRRLIVDFIGVALKGPTGMPTVTNLVMMNDASFNMAESAGGRMSGTVLLHPVRDANRTFSMRMTGSAMKRHMDLHSTLSGYGDLFMQGIGNPAYGTTVYTLHSDSPAFFGKTRGDGSTNFWIRVASEEKLGGNPPLFRADQLSFNGGGLSVTNDVTLDDSNRGITLLATGGTAGTSADPGSFTNNTPAELRRYEGGCVLRPESNSVTLTVACPVTGAGTLIKNGLGTLVLGGNNSYTGQTLVIAGALRPASTNALGTGPLWVKATGTLTRRHPAAGMADGVALGSTVTFESGSKVVIELEAGFTVPGNFTVPLFSMPTGLALDPATVPVSHSLPNYKATVVASDAGGGRTLFTAELAFQGTLMMMK